MGILNYNPGIYPTLGPGYPEDSGDDEDRGKVWEWILNNGDDAIDIVDSVLCVVNPRRPGCRGATGGGGSGGVVVTQDNAILYAILAVVVVLLLVFIFKK